MSSVGKKRILIWGGIGLVIVTLLAIGLAPRAVPADIEMAVEGPLRVVLEHEGITRIRNPFVISAPVDGRVRRIELEPGDPVRANETVLVTFEPVDPVLLDARSRAEAEAALKAAQAGLTRSRAERERARAAARLAATELERIRDLTQQQILAQQSLDAAEAEAEASHEALAAADSAVRAAQHELEAAQARLMTPGVVAAEGRGSTNLQIRSPIDGVVLRRIRQSEAVVPRGEPLLEVADPSDLEIVADFLSTDAVRIQPGMPVLIDRWGGGRVLHARVRRVEPAGFMKISALGVEEQRVNVIADFDDPLEAWEALGDRYRVQVGVVVWESEKVLQVPTSSLFRSSEDWAIYVVEGGKARLRRIEIGHRTGSSSEVLEGLQPEDRIIAHPSDAISDGVRVKPRGS